MPVEPHPVEDRRRRHGHDHGRGDHARATPSARGAHAPSLSLLRTSAMRRLAGVFAALIVVWAAVAWALA